MDENMDLDLEFGLEDYDFTVEKATKEADESKDDDTVDDETTEAALANAAFMDLATEEDYHELAESTTDMQDLSEVFGVAMERTIVRLDRNSRLRHINKQAQLNLARQNNDPNYRKLLKVWEMERALEAKIAARWGSKAKNIANTKIRDYASNGQRKFSKPNSSTVAYKGKVSSRVAQRAVSQSKRMFSNSNRKTAGR